MRLGLATTLAFFVMVACAPSDDGRDGHPRRVAVEGVKAAEPKSRRGPAACSRSRRTRPHCTRRARV